MLLYDMGTLCLLIRVGVSKRIRYKIYQKEIYDMEPWLKTKATKTEKPTGDATHDAQYHACRYRVA